MIEPFLTEQYLPCRENEVIGIDRARRLPDGDYFVTLNKDIEIVPMYAGGVLSTNHQRFYVDENAISLISDLTSSPRLSCLHTKCKSVDIELERLHYYGLLDFSGKKNGKVLYRNVPQDIKNLYCDGEYGWFFYYPTKIELDLSNLCNFSCIHCSRSSSPKTAIQKELSLHQIKQIISESAKLGVYSFQLMGGEPLLHKNFFEICEHAKSEGIRHLDTSSNGWCIDKKTAQSIAKYFNEIQLSLHGATEQTHDLIVKKKGAWKRVLNAGKLLSSVGVSVRLSMTVMEQNHGELELMPKIAREMGATTLRFLVLSNLGRGKKLKGWTIQDRSEIGLRIKNIFIQEKDITAGIQIACGGFPALTPIKTQAQFYGCPAGRELLYINAEGKVSCCGTIENYIGNIKDYSLLELWHHPKMVKLRKVIKCNCEFNDLCAGSCLSNFMDPYDKIANDNYAI